MYDFAMSALNKMLLGFYPVAIITCNGNVL